MPSNSKGEKWAASNVETMTAFDTLPIELRDALRHSVRNWSAAQVLDGLRKGMPAHIITSGITLEDRAKCVMVWPSKPWPRNPINGKRRSPIPCRS